MAARNATPVILFGYDSSAFTQKVRLALRLKQIPYTFLTVPSMMPRPLLRNNLHLTYRKIPVLAIGNDVYCDTSLILEALEEVFDDGYASLYPRAADGRTNRPLIRGFESYWTDRPLFRVATGLMPSAVWRTSFGTDRAGLIGHKLDPDKLESKRPRNLSGLDLHLSLLEPQLDHKGWIFSTPRPSLADISLYYMLDWARDFSSGRGIEHLTAGETKNENVDFTGQVFNGERYPNVTSWFQRFREFMADLPSTEQRVTRGAEAVLREHLRSLDLPSAPLLLKTPAPPLADLDARNGLVPGVEVDIVPDDTGRDDPTRGHFVTSSAEELVITPTNVIDAPDLVTTIRLHFPRLGFVVKPIRSSKI